MTAKLTATEIMMESKMTLEEALEIGKGKAISLWRGVSLDDLLTHPPGQSKQPIGKVLVLQRDKGYTIAARKYGEEHISKITTEVPGWDELCMVVTGPPYMALTLDGWKPAVK